MCMSLKATASNICEYKLDIHNYRFFSMNTTSMLWVRATRTPQKKDRPDAEGCVSAAQGK